MRKKIYIQNVVGISIIFWILLLLLFLFWHVKANSLTNLQAINIVKTAYPEFANYPNDHLPPQSIKTEKDSDGWYIAFVQEGSGRPIVWAKCFFVKNDSTLKVIWEFKPEAQDIDFSLRTCTKK